MIPFSLFNFKINSLISIIPSGSSPFIGSSKRIKSGFPTNAIAIPKRCFIPKEKYFAFLFFVLSSLTIFNISYRLSSSGIPTILYCSFKFSSAVILRQIEGFSIIAPILPLFL